jgi:predicted ATPase with chaperone activity
LNRQLTEELHRKMDAMTRQPGENSTAELVAALSPAVLVPQPPASCEAAGLPFEFLVDLMLKTFFKNGNLSLWELGERLKLPVAVVSGVLDFLRSEALCEVTRARQTVVDISYQLSSTGRERAETVLQKSQYVGPAPVSLAAYTAQVASQRIAQMRVSRAALNAAFHDLVIDPHLRDDFGAAINSTRAMLVYGPSGSGKTYIAEHLMHALSGQVYIPEAILVDGEVIQIFDPLVHQPVETPSRTHELDRWSGVDARWTLCKRPVVMCGGELTLSMLDLQFDTHSRFYVAPPQIKANNGLLIIDDLGRQLVSPRDLMNRWIVPLDRRIDHFSLHTGMKFSLPFDVNVIFSSNLKPSELADEAFLRRLGYKIQVGEMEADDYRQIFVQACERTGVAFSEAAFRHLLLECHRPHAQPLLACIPLDLIRMIRDRAAYLDKLPEMTGEALNWAWQTYFARE